MPYLVIQQNHYAQEAPMALSIHFGSATVKDLATAWQGLFIVGWKRQRYGGLRPSPYPLPARGEDFHARLEARHRR